MSDKEYEKCERDKSDNGSDQRPHGPFQAGRLADRLEKAIGRRSMRSIAQSAGLSEGTIRNLLRGGTPSLLTLAKLAPALGCSESWLATGEGKMRPDETDLAFDAKLDALAQALEGLESNPADAVADDVAAQDIRYGLQAVANSRSATSEQRARADKMLQLAFQDMEASERVEARSDDVLGRLREISVVLARIEEEAGFRPSSLWHETIKTLMFSHGLDQVGAARLVQILRDTSAA